MVAAGLQGDDVTFISYAQNAEDVMLFRALGHVANGFYIDVGAQDPINDSVTRAFYDRGWHGINVEPVQRWFERLQADRPRDVNVQAIVADKVGTETIREVVDTGLSTVDPDIAQQHSLGGHAVVEFQVRATTLDDLCREHGVDTVHFLKVDVEGHEAKVLAGMSFDAYRPWVLLIEATAPNSQVETHGEWEPGVLARDYVFVYADGLNRFYVAREKYAELKGFFLYPPNFFDDYERMPVNWLRHHAERLERDLAQVTEQRDDLLSLPDSPGDVSDHDLLVTMRERYRRLRAERIVMRRQVRKAEAEVAAIRSECSAMVEDARAARQYRMELFAAEERVTASERQIDLLRTETGNLRHYVQVLEQQAGNLEAAYALERAEANHLREQLAVILGSSSWRLTRPLRVIRRLASQPAAHGGRRAILRRVAGRLLRTASRMPGARRLDAAVLRRMPRVRQRLLRLYGVQEGTRVVPLSTTVGLSPIASQYALALKGADERRDSPRGHDG